MIRFHHHQKHTQNENTTVVYYSTKINQNATTPFRMSKCFILRYSGSRVVLVPFIA
jgi:hypothetical protein